MGRIILSRLVWLVLTGWILMPALLPAADATITVTKEQAGREVALKAGDILQIELPSRGGTGYTWFLKAAAAPYLKLISETTQPVGEPRPGSPVMQVWRFKAERPGACDINLAYYRPWEGVGQAVDHFGVKLRID